MAYYNGSTLHEMHFYSHFQKKIPKLFSNIWIQNPQKNPQIIGNQLFILLKPYKYET
jgi:Flp pilus assembly CpaE family ATPase